MSYSFWDTVQGNRLAQVLIRELPELNKPKKQIAVEENKSEAAKAIQEKLEEGYILVHVIQNSSTVTLVFEK